MHEISFEQALARLQTQPMLALPALKHALMLRGQANYFQLGGLIAVRFRPSQTPWDQSDYPAAQAIQLLACGSDADILAYLAALKRINQTDMPIGEHVLKLNTDLEALGADVVKVKAFTSLSADQSSEQTQAFAIEESNVADECLSTLLGLTHYTANEVNRLLAGGGLIFWVRRAELAIACAIVYPNWGNVWEVGAVATLPEHQGHGVGAALVRHATNHLIGTQRVPRYHVNQNNQPSLRLALRCGYKPFMNYFHCRVNVDL